MSLSGRRHASGGGDVVITWVVTAALVLAVLQFGKVTPFLYSNF